MDWSGFAMSDDGKHDDYSGRGRRENHAKPLRPGAVAANRRVDGWEAYRNWLTRVREDKGRRSRVDRSLYTWKGYKDWTEKIKQNWDSED